MALSVEVMRVLAISKEWMTQVEISEQIKPSPGAIMLRLTLSILVDQERIERHKEKGVVRYRLMQLGGSRAPKTQQAFWPKFAVPQPV